MSKVKVDAIKNDPSGESSECADMADRLIRDIDGIRLCHGRAQKTLIGRLVIMTMLGLRYNQNVAVPRLTRETRVSFH